MTYEEEVRRTTFFCDVSFCNDILPMMMMMMMMIIVVVIVT